MRKGCDGGETGGEKARGEKKEKTDENSGHYPIATRTPYACAKMMGLVFFKLWMMIIAPIVILL